MSQITDMARYRAARQRPATDLCRWSEALEKIAATNLRIAFAWQRGVMRYLFGALLILGVTGCATDAAVIRITEYRAGTLAAAVSGQGIAVTQSGKEQSFSRVQILYTGDKATVAISSNPEQRTDAISH